MLPIPQSDDSSQEIPAPITGEFILNPPFPTPKSLLKPDRAKTGGTGELEIDFDEYNHALTVHVKSERLSLFVSEISN